MKKFFTYTLCALMAAVSCDVAQIGKTDDYNPAKVPDTPQVYFSKDTQSSEIALTQEDIEFNVGLARVDSAEPLDVEIVAEGETENFLIPSVVKFAAGEKTANLKIQISSPLSPNEFKTITLKLADASLGSEYGATSITFKVGVNLPWKKFGAGGTFNEVWWNETEEKQIEYQEISDELWLCKIPQCFGKETIAAGKPYDCQDVMFYWNKVTNNLYMVAAYMGDTSSKGPVLYGSAADLMNAYFKYDGGTPGTPEWFEVQEIGFKNAAYNGFTLRPYYDGNGIFYLGDAYYYAEPDVDGWETLGEKQDYFVDNGFTHTDYTIDVAYDGMYVNPDGQASALLNITAKGADAKLAKYMITSQDVDPATTLETILAGEDPAINTAPLTQGVPSVQQLDIEPGLYRAVVVPGDDKTLSADDAVAIDFYFPGVSGEKKEVEVSLVLDKPEKIWTEEFIKTNGLTDYNSVSFVLYGKEIKSASYYFNTSAAIATWKNPLEDLVATYGRAYDAATIESLNKNGLLASYFSNVSPATEYEMIIVATNVYGSTKTLDVKYTTAAMPYSGELVIGNYSVATMSGAPSVITIEPTPTENLFTVKNLLIADGTKFNALYSSSDNTLTLDGTIQGYEKYGNLFGQLWDYFPDGTNSYLYDWESYASETSEGTDPIIFDVDPATHKLIAVHPECYCSLYSAQDGSYAGDYEGYADGAAVAYIPANTAVAKRTASAATLSKTISTNVKHQAKAGRKSVVNRFEISANKVLSNNYFVKPGLFTRTIDGWSKRIEISRKGKTFSAHTAQFIQVR